jgi:tricarballylate dehydrogenase
LKEYWGDAARKFHHPRHAAQSGRHAERAAQTRRQAGGRSARLPRRGARRRAPKFDGGIVTRLDSVPFGIVVNQRGEALLRRGRRFLAQALCDLGQAHRRAAEQIAYSIIDAKGLPHFMPSVFPTGGSGSMPSWPRLGNSIRARSRRSSMDTTAPRAAGDSIPAAWTTAIRTAWFRRKAMGAAHRHAAILWLSAAARHTFTYLGVTVNEQRAGDHARRRAGKKFFAAAK